MGVPQRERGQNRQLPRTLFNWIGFWSSSPSVLYRLVESNIFAKIFATVQPHTLPISGNDKIFDNLLIIINICIDLALPYYLRELGITAAVDKYNHRERIFQKVMLPSSQFLTFLISNRLYIKGETLSSFMMLLSTLLQIGPFHRPILEFVIASPIVMGFSSCLSFVELFDCLWDPLGIINSSLELWRKEGGEVVQSGKLIIKALSAEGFEDTIEQLERSERDGSHGQDIERLCRLISHFKGSNVFVL
ncbi:hypothetical protein BLNAU_17897 [Blattamonas nauphoetae]|uniref:Uncharacterized protein n=1 Tax=Blattamonas nauphoetae TaxID=2049346 RepID=A0ABQ9X5Z3_9EUKA|nr:hypothetical protein BLNAU_17897 [Blattamonas nauphoetae]